MIFVAVGTQLPFDRLVRAVDEWAAGQAGIEIVAQIGPTRYQPRAIHPRAFLGADEFQQHVRAADLVVAHAGMGSIIQALELGKRIIVMPRRADLGEHRNDHQMATARQLERQGRVNVVYDAAQLVDRLAHIEQLPSPGRISSSASPQLIEAIRDFIDARVRTTAALDPPVEQAIAQGAGIAQHS